MDRWGPLETPIYNIISTRTDMWTDALIARMDPRNQQRLQCLPPVWQEHVVRTYSVREGQVVKDENKHIGATITGVRRLLYGGITEEECGWLQALAANRARISYLPCTQYEQRGNCRYGNMCTHPHIDN